MTTAERTALSELIAGELERCNGSVDAGEVAQRIVPELDREVLEQLAWSRVRSLVVDYIAQKRPPATKKAKNGGPPASARWAQVREVKDALDQWYVSFMDRPSKHILECSPEDLTDSADWFESRAEGYLARAEAYRKLAAAIRRAKGSTAADLPREKVRRILNA